jgi:Xaa-Pro aminopeptidase
MIDLEKIQKFLKSENLDGWLMADFHRRNTIMADFLSLPEHITRRGFFFIPADGEPVGIVHNIERDRYTHLPGKKIFFSAYVDLEKKLKKLLGNVNRVAMEYSPAGRLPYVGLVDAGTIELIRSFDVEVVSSADLVANFQARLTDERVELHREAARKINQIKDNAFLFIRECLMQNRAVDERMVVDYIWHRFGQENLVADFKPVCAVEKNISNPHYDPSFVEPSVIEKNKLVLIDLWAKLKQPKAVFADITWMAYTGRDIPDRFAKEFEIVTSARDRAVQFLKESLAKRPVYGYEVDDACREVIEKSGNGEYFHHRTGHSIFEEVHGPGPSIDNLETEDRRQLLPGHLFSVEPGMYFGEHGYRSEIDVLITGSGPEITTMPLQDKIISILD